MNCPKCNQNKFIDHEDGLQCLNCLKIIYLKDGRPVEYKTKFIRHGRQVGTKIEPV